MSDARFSRRERRPVRQFANMRSGEEIDAFLLANSEPMSPVLATLPSAHPTSASHAPSAAEAAAAAASASAAAASRPASTATTTTGRGRGRPRGSGRKQRAAKAKQQQQLQQQLQQQQQQQSVSRNSTGAGSLVVSDQHSSLFEEESSSDTGGAGPAVLGAAALRVQQEGHHHMHGNELYCICRRPYDPRMFMIGCDRCDGWFHAACVNISINEAKRMESYTCPNCKKPCQEPAAAASTSSTAAAAVAVSGSMQTPKTALIGTSITKKRKRKHNGSGRSRGLFGFQHNDDIANLWMRFSDTYGQDTQQQKLIDAEDDTNVILSDESEENNQLDSVLVRRSLFVDLDHASEVGRDDFGSEEDLRRWQGLDASDRDQEMQRHIALKLLECDETIDSLEIQKRLVELGLAFARRASLELRLETLAKSHADIALVARIDRQMRQPLPPNVVSSICLRCKGDVPTSELAEHLQRCLDIEPLPALSLHYVVVPYRHHHRDDTWLDEDDWDGSAPLLVCGYPKRLRAASSSANEPATDQQCCQQRRSDCMEHTGWDGCVTAELAQRSSLLERRRRRLHDELQLIRERITRRLEFAIKYVQSNSLPQLSASPPAIDSLSNVAAK